MTDIDGLNLESMKCLVKWSGDNKAKQEVEDILTAVTVVDEKYALIKLPHYSFDNLDNLPLMRMERGEFAILISRLDKIEETMANRMHLGQ